MEYIKRLRLSRQVSIKGFDFFGRKAKITFFPCYNPGWHWMCGNKLVPINSKLVICDRKRIALRYGKHRLQIYEHIGALRFTGLDFIAVQSSEWSPYFGRVLELWEALKPFCIDTEEKIPWVRLKNKVSASILGRNGNYRSVSLSPMENKLEMEVIADFRKFGRSTFEFKYPYPLEDVFQAYTLGWPPYLHDISEILSEVKIWKHHNHMVWLKNDPSSVIRETARHRAVDILGTISLVAHDALPSGKLVSFRGSHKLDMRVMSKIEIQS
jgi:hypothetical protein